jgi:apolipoprotein N-acyltransferase
VFPNLTRTAVKRGADILVNITNDAWYGTSSAPYQLLAMAAMRSIETKVPMVRVANTGISAIIQSDGTITARTALFRRGTETEHVYWRRERTIYTQFGDIFAEACLALTLLALAIALMQPRPAARRQEEVSSLLSANGHRY